MYDYINSFDKFEYEFILVLSQISYIALYLTLLEDEQKFKLERYVDAHKISISYVNMSSKYIK
jgi:hypothetical protein